MTDIQVHKPTEEELVELGVRSWSIWTCEPSTFDWHYDDKEICYLLEGQVTVKTDNGEVSFGAGDMVVFPEGLSCVWQVSEGVRKHYKFG
jgi:uncharacterized cupin superfamily protein